MSVSIKWWNSEQGAFKRLQAGKCGRCRNIKAVIDREAIKEWRASEVIGMFMLHDHVFSLSAAWHIYKSFAAIALTRSVLGITGGQEGNEITVLSCT